MDLEQLEEMAKERLRWFRVYRELKWTVIPGKRDDKHPAFAYKDAAERPSDADIEMHIRENPECSLCWVLGPGDAVIDTDTAEGEQWVLNQHPEQGPIQKTLRGFHRVRRVPLGVTLASGRIAPGVDLKVGPNAVVLLEPSADKEWKLSPHEADTPELEQWAIEARRRSNDGPRVITGSSDLPLPGAGRRNDTAARLTGRWINLGMNEAEVKAALRGWYHSLSDKDGFSLEEAARVADSIWAKHIRGQTALVFPRRSITGISRDFTDVYSESLEPPFEFFAMSFLTALGASLNPKATINVEIHPQPRLYTLLLGATGETRKSTAIHKTYDFFKRAVPELTLCTQVNSAEGLLRRLASIEGESKAMLLCWDELATFVGKCRVEGSVLLSVVTSLFHQNLAEAHTSNRTVQVPDVHLSILLASTSDTFQAIWETAFTNIGFNNRLFVVPAEAANYKPAPTPIPEPVLSRLAGSVRRVIKGSYERPVLDMTTEARSLWSEWYYARPRSIHAVRLDSYGMILMIVLAHSAGKRAIDAELVGQVAGLLDWQFQARRQNDPIDADNKFAHMEEAIRRALHGGPLYTSQIQRKTNAKRVGLYVFNTAMKNLRDNREVRQVGKTRRFELRKIASTITSPKKVA